MPNHDKHYKDDAVETIQIQEWIMREFSGDIGPDRAHLVAHASKYLRRAGKKDGEPWEKDLQKFINYIHRAITGVWIGEE